MVAGMGLGDALRRKGTRSLLLIGAVALLIANTINIGADLSGMADAMEMLTGLDAHFCILLFAIGTAFATIRFRYRQIATVMKWLTLVLCAYIINAFIIGPDWPRALRDTFLPSLPSGKAGWTSLVAIFGTTISPYLFFWQSSQEVEEEKTMGRQTLADRVGATQRELRTRQIDVGAGTFFSNIVMYFIILTTALTLHRHGLTNITTSREAAEALRPLAGNLAAALYTAGIIGVGILAIPTLTGSAAYALAETFSWREGLDEPWRRAIPFYAVVVVATLLGVALNLLKISPIKALFYSAVINGVLAPFLLVGIVVVASDRKLMAGQPSSWPARIIVGLTALLMFAAAAAMLLL
jgi:Mn2+/Fe2+ NRAMP family transporter